MVKVLIIQPNTTYRSSTIVSLVDQVSKYEVCSSHFYVVCSLLHFLYPHKNYYSSCIRQLWTALTIFNSQVCVQHTPHYFGNVRGLRTSSTTRVLHLKVITNQDVRICINIHTKLSIAVANIDCEGFSITHIFIF
jgi:hypothetical protein